MRRKSNRKDLGKGHIPSVVRGSRKLYNFLWGLTDDLNFNEIDQSKARQHNHEFLVHIYHSMLRQRLRKNNNMFLKEKGFIPIKGTLIDAEIGRVVDFRILEKAGIIVTRPYKHRAKKSRCYKLVDSIWEKARKIEDSYTRRAWQSLVDGKPKKFVTVNLKTGKQMRKARKHNLHPRDAHHKTPRLVKDSIKAISACPFDPKFSGLLVKAIGKIVRKSKLRLEEIQNKPRHRNNPDKTFSAVRKAQNRHFKLEQKYQNLVVSQATILGQQPKLLQEKSTKGNFLYSYPAAYEPQVSGRLTEKGGGMQNASRVFKHLCFKNVRNTFNYDLKASQANILAQELQDCGIDNSWIRKYLKDENAKKTYAELIGTDSDTWKACLYSTIMGAEVENKFGAVYEALLDYFANCHESADQAYSKFLEHAHGLIQCCEQWRETIYTGGNKKYTYKTSGFRFWKNDIGMKHKEYGIDRTGRLVLMESVYDNIKTPEKCVIKVITNQKEIGKLKRKLAAFMLQGKESYFIHHLTLLCANHSKKIKVLRNEHDGIICDHKIPDQLIIEAGKLSGFHEDPELDIKPLASDNDIKKMRELTKQ